VQRIEDLVARLEQPALFQDEINLGLLSDLGFSLEVDRGSLYCSFRTGKRTYHKRIIRIETPNQETMELTTSHLKALSSYIVRSAFGTGVTHPQGLLRKDFQKSIERLILKNFPYSKIHQSTLHSDLAHSLSGKYVRLHFTSGPTHWIAVAVNPWEDQATINGILSDSIIWQNTLAPRIGARVGRLLLIVPSGRSLVLRNRLGLIRNAGRDLFLMEMDVSKGSLQFQDLTDSGNVDTALTQVHSVASRSSFAERANYQRIMSLAPHCIQPFLCAGSNTLSFRIHGLEFAQLYLGESKEGKPSFGISRMEPLTDWRKLESLVNRILEIRKAATLTPNHEIYRLQAERWLESQILGDIQQIDSQLNPNYVYPQVPAFLAGDRGMIDILTVTKQGRLAILELKVAEDIELPLQGLDYWLRVRWHQRRQEFTGKGYFRSVELSPDPPILYFVCPQFCYHSTFPQVIARIDRSVPMVQVGINENWREGIQIVLRRARNRTF
jgi:hypothetical protein